mmetsp:Transcript_25763/g.46542  ORF Transcript_25763/g.46542 Transcript_25763/m.46542 type:complete len:86 (+) Transcript_25763:709-966(+)
MALPYNGHQAATRTLYTGAWAGSVSWKSLLEDSGEYAGMMASTIGDGVMLKPSDPPDPFGGDTTRRDPEAALSGSGSCMPWLWSM